MTALWVTIGVLGVLCLWLGRQHLAEYTQVDALHALKPLIATPRKKRASHLFRFQWRLAKDLERRRSQ